MSNRPGSLNNDDFSADEDALGGVSLPDDQTLDRQPSRNAVTKRGSKKVKGSQQSTKKPRKKRDDVETYDPMDDCTVEDPDENLHRSAPSQYTDVEIDYMAKQFIKSFGEISGPGDSRRFLLSVRAQDPSVATALEDAVNDLPEYDPFNADPDDYTERYKYGDVRAREVIEVQDQQMLTGGDSHDGA